MALSNRERIDRGLHVLRDGLAPFVERQIRAALRKGTLSPERLKEYLEDPLTKDRRLAEWDAAALLRLMWELWNDAFHDVLGQAERTLVSELRNVRNRWAHQQAFSYEDTHRALDSMERLLRAVAADREAREIEQMRHEVLRVLFDEKRRVEERRRQRAVMEGAPQAGLAPWREVVTPHPDVASGRFTLAEFAADLAQVARGEAAPEYQDPVEFFRRTFMTGGLRELLRRAVLRLTGGAGDPVVELQTTFGGGKTHSMLAVWHLAGHPDPLELPGVEEVLREAGVSAADWRPARRAAFVGTAFSPAETHVVNGIEVRTAWGAIAAQLLGAEGYRLVQSSDLSGTSPGSERLVELLRAAAPCAVLIDEWVAMLRQLGERGDLPAGGFEANITFAQALSEAVKAVPGALLLASLPESDVELGGDMGRIALQRLEHVFGRIESGWRPATAEEGYEIVRRRLFEPLTAESYPKRDAVLKAFLDLYRESGAQFPSEAAELEYRKRMERAYPVHPEFFDRLNEDWGSLDRFQRTRGLLRMMATVVHCLWEAGDRSLLIMPGAAPLGDVAVRARLFEYLPQPWDAVVDADVEGPDALAPRIDREYPSLGRYRAALRVARATFVATAPRFGGPNPGIDDRRLKLATVQPGEPAGVFGDALRRLAEQSTYLYVDGSRYWFSTRPNVRRVAEDIARDLEPETVREALLAKLRELVGRRREIAVQIAPQEPADVPDEPELRLVVLAPEHAHHPRSESKAATFVRDVVTRAGERPRRFRNVLLFVAPDERRLEAVEAAVRRWLAWRQVLERHDELNLDAAQERQARHEAEHWEKALCEALLQAWSWAVAPRAPAEDPHGSEVEIRELRGDGDIVERALRRFRRDETIVETLGPVTLADTLDKWNLWREAPHVAIGQLVEDFASYLYLPRLASGKVLVEAVRQGVGRLADWPFAVAEGVDGAGRYRGLVAGRDVRPALSWLLVRREVAIEQIDGSTPSSPPPPGTGRDGEGPTPPDTGGGEPARPRPRRYFHGSLELGPQELVKKAGTLWEEILRHLEGVPGAKVRLRLDIEAECPNGFDGRVRRIVQENAAVLRLLEAVFEE